MEPDWTFWSESYQGGEAYRSGGHLFKFPRETKDNYDERLKRAHRLNFTQQVLDLVVQYLCKEPAKRNKDKATEPVSKFWDDVDRHGTNIDDFSEQLATQVGIFGVYYVVVDKPNIDVQTKAQQDELGARPYVYTVSPLDMLDFVIDKATGHIKQALVREWTRGEVDLRKERDNDKCQEQFRLWYLDGETVKWEVWVKTDKDPKKTEEGVLQGIKRVPIIPVTRTGGSLIGDVAAIDRAVYNRESLLDQILHDQTFSTLIVPWSGDVSDFYQNWEVKMGTKTSVPYDPELKVAPGFISPDAGQATLLLDANEKLIARIYKLSNLQDTVGGSSNQTSGQPSGIARGYDFEKLNAGLAKFADNMEKAEEAIAELVNEWEGVTDELPSDLIDYPDKFDVKTLTQELLEFNQLAVIQSQTFNKYMQKEIVKKAAPKLEEALQTTIENEIDAAQDINEEHEKEADKLPG